MTATAREAVAYARSFVGKVQETPPGSNRTVIGKTYGWDGVAYCAEGMWVVLNYVKVPVVKTASAHLMVDSFARKVTRFDELRPGDVVGWNFDADPNTIPNIHHVSMVSERPANGYVRHVGFNTSPPSGGGSEWNGEGCWEKPYPSSFFCVAGRPLYGDGQKPRDGKPHVRMEFGIGDKGSDVRLWQHLLNVVDKAGLKVDGEFGAKTVRATVEWQRAHQVKPDGTVYLGTIRTLERKVAAL